MLYNSNILFQKIPDKVSFLYAQMSEKMACTISQKNSLYTLSEIMLSQKPYYT